MRRAIPLLAFGWLLAGCPEDPLCADDDACGTAQCVDGACQPASSSVVIESFAASPTQVVSGAPVTLAWRTRDASRCELEPDFGAVPRTGSVVARPEVTSTFSLACTGSGAAVDADVTVGVISDDAGPALDGGDAEDAGDGSADNEADGGELDGGQDDAGQGADDAGEDAGHGAGNDAGDDAGPEPPVLVTITGDVQHVPAPESVDEMAVAGGVFLFQERAAYTVTSWQLADAHFPGRWGTGGDFDSSEPRCQIVSGQVVDSWLLHVSSPNAASANGSLTFAREIVAIAWRDGSLEDGDLVFGREGTTYTAIPNRSFSVSGNDAFELSADRHTVSFTAGGTNVDELRILVAAGPAPPLMVQTWTATNSSATDLTAGVREELERALLMDEGTTTLDSPLSVEILSPGKYQAALTASEGELPSGRSVRSWIVHFDPPQGTAATQVVASVTFPTPVVGILLSDAALAGSDAALGLDDVTYPAESLRGVELKDVEQVWLGEDRRSVRFILTLPIATPTIDQLRILTEL